MTPEEVAETIFDPKLMPAFSVAVARPNGIAWQAAFGSADLEMGVAATPDHRFQLGSLSKALTATAAARLAMRGLIELDTPIAYWLPDLPEQHRATTLRQLLTHRGGVRHYAPHDLNPKAPGGMVMQRQYFSNADILALFIDDELVAEPGTEANYSSYGYSLASIVMEAATGTDFGALIAEEIARPFALPSLAMADVNAIVPGRVRGYFSKVEIGMLKMRMPEMEMPLPDGNFANVPLNNPAFCWAGAGMTMSMPDCARFGAAMIESEHSLLTQDERDLLFTVQVEATKKTPPLGLGWRIDEDKQGRLRWHHAGGTPGARASLVVYPDLGLSIAFASNVMMTPGDVLGPSSDFADAFE